jgi:DNA-binding NtrC family response regulator
MKLDLSDPQDTTQTSPHAIEATAKEAPLAFTVIWHPRMSMMGAQALVRRRGQPWSFGRTTPVFRLPDRAELVALDHRALSRSPLVVEDRADGSVGVSLPQSAMQSELNGQSVTGGFTLTSSDLKHGAILIIGGALALCIHRLTHLPDGKATTDLCGVSDLMVRVRCQIARFSATDAPVLLLGETGTGKECAAQAIHANSTRRNQPMVAINMAALTETLAGAELFGSVKGAFTGAQQARQGYWGEAAGGSLFLDEIGDTPALVQPMLLRAIETGRYRPIGGAEDQAGHVRFIAATDRDLTSASFNQPLLRRLEGCVISLPPLRHRREDIGLLCARFLTACLGYAPEAVVIPSDLVRAICLSNWPGNVRQLMQCMRRLAFQIADGSSPELADVLGVIDSTPPSTLEEHRTTTPGATPEHRPPFADAFAAKRKANRRDFRRPSTVSGAELLVALEGSGWQLSEAATRLGISRPSLYNLMDRHPSVRRAEKLRPEEVQEARARGASDLSSLAIELRIPREALRRRLREWQQA